MKQKTHHLYYLFYPRGLVSLCRSGWIIFALLLCNAVMFAQEQTPPKEFVLDASMNYGGLWIAPIYNSFIDCGFNTIIQRATPDSKSLLDRFNVNAFNALDSTEWIYYYSSSYYSKWEAEEDQLCWNKVGVKHSIGEAAYWRDNNDSVLCWSTKGLTGPADTIVYGPTYHQEKWYRRWYTNYTDEDRYNLQYTPRFRMALDIKGNVSPNDSVCRIYVLLKYRVIENDTAHYTDSTFVLKPAVTLKVSDFPDSGKFDYIYFSDIPSQRSYKYWSGFRDPETDKLALPSIENIYRDDRWPGTGVQFCIDWLRTDTLCTLYVDNIEVYDNNGWDAFITDPVAVTENLIEYARNYSAWSNIKHWMGGHEPSSIDSYVPIRTVDSILQSDSVNAPPLMNVVWAIWGLNVNGESQLERYYNMVRPNKLMVEFHPILEAYDPVRPFDLEVLRRVLQESYRVTQDSKFYYHAQSYGEWKNGDWFIWRFPSVAEHKATIMLALSHGADGITQASYDSYVGNPGVKALIRESPDYDTTDVWYSLRDNIIPRLKGNLGKTLLSLNYTGEFLGLRRYLQEEPDNNFYNTGSSVNNLYLTLSEYTVETLPPPVHFHAGFFEKLYQPDNHHFFLTNLITTDNRYVNVKVINDCSVFLNTRFRNIEREANFDTTFTCEFSTDMLFPPGEGRLYQVAPVVKYGGKLIYNENI